MKKLCLSILILILISLSAITIISWKRVEGLQNKFYAVNRMYSFIYDSETPICFELYCNQKKNWISLVKENHYYLEDETISFKLENVKVIESYNSKMSGEEIYQYKIYTDMPNLADSAFILKNASIIIKNEAKTLKQQIGYVSIAPKYTLLNLSDLYGNYSYIDEELHLVGITIALQNEYKFLQKVGFGEAFCDLEYIEKNKIMDSQLDLLDIKHSIIKKHADSPPLRLNAKSRFYFIPLSYPTLRLITEGGIILWIDNEIYFIENFCYLTNNILLCDYPNSKIEGKVDATETT